MTEPTNPGASADAPVTGAGRATDDFEEMLAGLDRIIEDRDLQRRLLDAGLLVRTYPAQAKDRLRAALADALPLVYGDRYPSATKADWRSDADYLLDHCIAPEAEAADLRVPQEAEGLADPSGLQPGSNAEADFWYRRGHSDAVAQDNTGLRAALIAIRDASPQSYDWYQGKARAALAATPPASGDVHLHFDTATDREADYQRFLHPKGDTPPASGPLTSGSNEPEGLDVERLREVVTHIGAVRPWLMDRAKGEPNEGLVLADVIAEFYKARLANEEGEA